MADPAVTGARGAGAGRATSGAGAGLATGLHGAVCFQHFGFDVILKTDLTPRIAEVNALPEMDAMNPRYAAIKDRVLVDGLAAAGLIDRAVHGFVQIG